ncbi:hypothetical protein FA10DRAFT_301540 [Acaromyces ingoldii]|uniref:Zn(2)-C6 fungal-type domain-containing protein n=1 Tax=Acaromyces ingoldii TaxID=215250 RepID=A0A316YL33_9BASI|nr:hypothetical protein FA10DRAFT_301540 [Acaromyces ingoldii]PWN90270.1 hypothetical protein FA10DRAFT_301540 [Acaromyces ingoldii]
MSQNFLPPNKDYFFDHHPSSTSSPGDDLGGGAITGGAGLVAGGGAAFDPCRGQSPSSSTSFDSMMLSKHAKMQQQYHSQHQPQVQMQQRRAPVPWEGDFRSSPYEHSSQPPPYELDHNVQLRCEDSTPISLATPAKKTKGSPTGAKPPSSNGTSRAKQGGAGGGLLSSPSGNGSTIERMTSACLLCRYRKIKCNPGKDPSVCATCIRRKKTCKWPEGKVHVQQTVQQCLDESAKEGQDEDEENESLDHQQQLRLKQTSPHEDEDDGGEYNPRTTGRRAAAAAAKAKRAKRAKPTTTTTTGKRGGKRRSTRKSDHSPDTSEGTEVITPTVSSSSPLFKAHCLAHEQQQQQHQHQHQVHINFSHHGLDSGYDYSAAMTNYDFHQSQYYRQSMHTPPPHLHTLPPPPPPEYKLQQPQQSQGEFPSVAHFQQQQYLQQQQQQHLHQHQQYLGNSFSLGTSFGGPMQDASPVFAPQQQVFHPIFALQRHPGDYNNQQPPPTPPASAPLQQRGSDCFPTLQMSFQHNSLPQQGQSQALAQSQHQHQQNYMAQPSPSIDFLPPSPVAEHRLAAISNGLPYLPHSHHHHQQQQPPPLLPRPSSPVLPPTPATPMPSMQTMPEISLLLNKADTSTVGVPLVAQQQVCHSDREEEEEGNDGEEDDEQASSVSALHLQTQPQPQPPSLCVVDVNQSDVERVQNMTTVATTTTSA